MHLARPELSKPPIEHNTQGHRIWHAGTLSYTKTSLASVFGWLLWGDFAWMIKERALQPLVPLILQHFDASEMVTGLLIVTLPGALGLILGPIISYRSDRKRSRFGRRIPYLLATTPMAVAGIIGCAFSAHMGFWLHGVLGVHSPGMNITSLICFGVWWVLFEIGTVATNAVFYSLINDVVPRPLLGRFFGLFRAISLFAGIIFNLFLIKRAETNYVIAFVIIGVLYGAGFALMCCKIKEGDYPPPDDIAGHPGILGAAKNYFRECFHLAYYWWVFAAVTLGLAAFIPVNLFSILHAKSLGIDTATYGCYVATTFSVSICLAYPLGMLADRFHPVRMAILTLALYATLTAWAGFNSTTRAGFAVAFIGHGVISGVFFTCTASITQRLFPKEKFAQFNSAAGILTALVNMAVAPGAGWVLDLTHDHYSNTYFAGLVICLLALITYLATWKRLLKLGGPKDYIAPE